MIKPGRQLRWQKKQKEMGKCPHCGKDPEVGRWACTKVLNKNRPKRLNKTEVGKNIGIYV